MYNKHPSLFTFSFLIWGVHVRVLTKLLLCKKKKNLFFVFFLNKAKKKNVAYNEMLYMILFASQF